MAITVDNIKPTGNVPQSGANSDNTSTESKPNFEQVLPKGNNTMMGTNFGFIDTFSEATGYAGEFIKAANLFFEEKKNGFTATLLDTTNRTIVLVIQQTESELLYHAIILGENPVPVANYVAEMTRNNNPLFGNAQYIEPTQYIPVEVVDNELFKHIEEFIVSRYATNQSQTLLKCNYTLVTEQVDIKHLIITAYNAIIRVKAVGNDVRITKQALENSNFSVNVTASQSAEYSDKKGLLKTKRSDLTTVLTQSTKKQQSYSLNTNSGIVKIAEVDAYLDAIPYMVPSQIAGNPPETFIHPHVVVTDLELAQPTKGMIGLGILTITSLLHSKNYLACPGRVSEKGILNRLRKIGGSDVDLILDPANDTQQAIDSTMDQIFNGTPVVSLDVTLGDERSELQILIAISEGNQRATAEMNEALASLFNVEVKVFENIPMFSMAKLIPTGHYVDQSGKHRDNRNVDFVAAFAKGDDFAREYINSERDADASFGLKCALLEKINPQALLVSKAYRLTFNPNFLNLIVSLTNGSGLKPTINNLVEVSQNFFDQGSIFGSQNVGYNDGFTQNAGTNKSMHQLFNTVGGSVFG